MNKSYDDNFKNTRLIRKDIEGITEESLSEKYKGFVDEQKKDFTKITLANIKHTDIHNTLSMRGKWFDYLQVYKKMKFSFVYYKNYEWFKVKNWYENYAQHPPTTTAEWDLVLSTDERVVPHLARLTECDKIIRFLEEMVRMAEAKQWEIKNTITIMTNTFIPQTDHAKH